eukprot:scaffold30063_cov51-Isochrysis_galbana.AAC.1
MPASAPAPPLTPVRPSPSAAALAPVRALRPPKGATPALSRSGWSPAPRAEVPAAAAPANISSPSAARWSTPGSSTPPGAAGSVPSDSSLRVQTWAAAACGAAAVIENAPVSPPPPPAERWPVRPLLNRDTPAPSSPE